MPIAHLNGCNLYYEDTGGDGTIVIFSHGFLLDCEMFATQVAALKTQFRCVSWDQRGFGRTGPTSESFTYWASARDLLALMDHLRIESAVLVGLSQGGFVSMRAALLAPNRVKALVLLSTRAGLDAAETIAGFHELAAEWSANGSVNVRDFLADKLIGTGADREPWLTKWATMRNEALAQPIAALTNRDDLTPRLREIACPVLVIHGDADTAIDLAHGRTLATGLNGILNVVAGAGHAPPLTHPGDVTAALRGFLSRVS